jgi:mediator of RNA polymerase II transcription subunit 8
MQRDEKLLDVTVDALIQRVQELRNSVTAFIIKLEQEHAIITWPTVLDNFAVLSGQISSLNRLLKSDKLPLLRKHVVIPLALSPDRDTELEKLTEGRVPCFNHEVAPSYLRTKPEPSVEEKMNALVARGAQLHPDILQKQIATLNKMTTSMLETIRQTRDATENELGRQMNAQQMSSQADTNSLIAAVVYGKSLKPSQRPSTPSASGPTSMPDPRISMPSGPPTVQVAKAPSTIKTNIKAAANMHPYGRP